MDVETSISVDDVIAWSRGGGSFRLPTWLSILLRKSLHGRTSNGDKLCNYCTQQLFWVTCEGGFLSIYSR